MRIALTPLTLSAAILTMLLIGWSDVCRAQDQSGTNMGSASTVQLTLVPSNEVPQRATFYSAQNRPPLPYDWMPDLEVYSLGNGQFVVDDRSVIYSTPGPSGRTGRRAGDETAPPANDKGMPSPSNAGGNGTSPLSLLAQAETNPPVPPEDLPRTGTFYSAQNRPPLPYDWLPDLQVYPLGNGQFVVDDSSVNYSAAGTQGDVSRPSGDDAAGSMDDSGAPLPPGAGGGGTNSYGGGGPFPVPSFSTNGLWLQMTGITNSIVSLNLNNAADTVYEVWTKTNLAQTNWNIETEVFPTNQQVMPFTIAGQGRGNLFVWARDWTGITSDGNQTPEWWFYEFYGASGLGLSDTNLDVNGVNTLWFDYKNGIDPTILSGLWLEALPPGTNAYNTNANALTFILHGTTNGSSYQIQTKASLTDTSWTPQQIFNGASGQGWTPITFALSGQPMLFFRAIVYSQDSTDSGLPDWWKLEYGLNPDSVSSGTSGVSDAYSDPAGDGWTDLQKFENGMNPNIFYTPPAPMVTVSPLPGDTGVLITWEPSLGNVTGYSIYRNYSLSPLATVGPNTFFYQDNSVSIDLIDPNASLPIYQVGANYTNGNSLRSAAQQPGNPNLAVWLQLIRGPQGQYFFVAPRFPKGVTTLRIFANPETATYPDELYDITGSSAYLQIFDYFTVDLPGNYYFDIAPTNFTNGQYAVPPEQLPLYNGYTLSCLPLGTNGAFGPLISVSQQFDRDEYADIPFIDGSQQVLQNLVFQMEAADANGPFQFMVLDTNRSDPFYGGATIIQFPSTYAYASYLFSFGSAQQPGSVLNEFKPFEDNCFYRNFIYSNLNDINANGSLVSGIAFQPYSIPVQIPSDAPYSFQEYDFVSGGGSNLLSPLLTTNLQRVCSPYPHAGNIGLYTVNGTNLAFAPNQVNIFGLAYQSILGFYSAAGSLDSQLFQPHSVFPNETDSGYTEYFYPLVAAPQLQTSGYFFGAPYREQMAGDQLPGEPGFSPTNTTGVIIAVAGQPCLISAWAEEQIVNGNANTPGYLQQYFDKAYTLDTYGDRSTNQTGILSEYGDFFPTDPGIVVLTTKTNFDGTQGSLNVPVIGLYTDRNHDGIIDTSYTGQDFCTLATPFRFWVNDDNDSGDTGGDDVPGEPASLGQIPNGLSGNVNGSRDLVDFFPVYVDVLPVLQMQTNPAYSSLQFRLSQSDGALNYCLTELNASQPIQYLTYLPQMAIVSNSPVTQITSNGVMLGEVFTYWANRGGGIILVEAWTNTFAPLVLDVLQGTNIIAEAQLSLSITGVEQMFRHKNLTSAVLGAIDGPPDRLTDSDVPNEPDNNGTNFIFLPGYNVNAYQARGWEAETFKRMFWSGSHAKFYGVTWDGYDTQTPLNITINLHTNEVHAFQTASALATFLETLNGTNFVAAHSLGNMVVLAALNDYHAPINSAFMIDAAVALEAVDGLMIINTNMAPPDWLDYSNITWASEFYTLFPANDNRNQLTWRNRLGNFHGANVYNFYSSGEEVLRNDPFPPDDLLGLAETAVIDNVWNDTPYASYLWCLSEKEKGRMLTDLILGSSHGGWGYNTNYGTLTFPPSQSVVAALTPSQLQTNPVFNTDVDGQLFTTSGSTFADLNQIPILSDTIPAVSYCVGANAVPDPGIVVLNINMQTQCETGWPASLSGGFEAGFWYHSDMREVAYSYTHTLLDDIVTFGNLK
jgi:hypothetical protein